MLIEQRVTVGAEPERVWRLLMDVPMVGRCVPGVESVTPIDPDKYTGVLRVQIGPISARLEGTLTLTERDESHRTARMTVLASDRRIGGTVSGTVTLKVEPSVAGGADIAVRTEAVVLGKLGQFGQAIIRRQAGHVMAGFAKNLALALGPEGAA